jgi:acyl dehydratase
VIAPGTPIPPLTMDEITIARVRALMELMHDTNPVHDDPDLVERRKLRGPVNQGPANLSYVLDMLFAWAGPELQLERLDFRFLDIVVPGDSVTASGTVTSAAPDAGDLVVGCDWRLDVDGGATAVTGSARLRIPGGARAGTG